MHRRCFISQMLYWMAGWMLSAQLAYSTPLTLATPYHPNLNLAHYWVSEKYDGIRAYWNGQQFLSRQGLPIEAPAWFTAGWPAYALDGELWAGRGQFAKVQSTVAQGSKDETGWQQLRYMVFDLPQHSGGFTQRYQALQQLVQGIAQPWVQAAPQWQVPDHATLMQQLRQFSQQGAEGLMLRHQHAPYRVGRSDDLIKLKLFDDAEAVVIGHLPGKGKYTGMTGALLVQTPEGLRFRIGSGLKDADRANPPPIGSTITYRYNGTHPSGVPRFARFWRVREEATSPTK
ncbi:DNA ligase [Comamonas kerstersii]|uniref:DNA ligase n=2 Tax=Comamonas kerstersii TaxID=225992 RepID=A0A1V0BHQ8_9BURK|nr:DNA ligase [Comamonas kerstersii]AQZ99456.1 DNA ligase [Comamonas kerstersii]